MIPTPQLPTLMALAFVCLPALAVLVFAAHVAFAPWPGRRRQMLGEAGRG